MLSVNIDGEEQAEESQTVGDNKRLFDRMEHVLLNAMTWCINDVVGSYLM